METFYTSAQTTRATGPQLQLAFLRSRQISFPLRPCPPPLLHLNQLYRSLPISCNRASFPCLTTPKYGACQYLTREYYVRWSSSVALAAYVSQMNIQVDWRKTWTVARFCNIASTYGGGKLDLQGAKNKHAPSNHWMQGPNLSSDLRLCWISSSHQLLWLGTTAWLECLSEMCILW